MSTTFTVNAVLFVVILLLKTGYGQLCNEPQFQGKYNDAKACWTAEYYEYEAVYGGFDKLDEFICPRNMVMKDYKTGFECGTYDMLQYACRAQCEGKSFRLNLLVGDKRKYAPGVVCIMQPMAKEIKLNPILHRVGLLTKDGALSCTGFAITNRIIITNRHCLINDGGWAMESIKFTPGWCGGYKSDADASKKGYDLQRVYVPTEYQNDDYDIAVLVLDTPLPEPKQYLIKPTKKSKDSIFPEPIHAKPRPVPFFKLGKPIVKSAPQNHLNRAGYPGVRDGEGFVTKDPPPTISEDKKHFFFRSCGYTGESGAPVWETSEGLVIPTGGKRLEVPHTKVRGKGPIVDVLKINFKKGAQAPVKGKVVTQKIKSGKAKALPNEYIVTSIRVSGTYSTDRVKQKIQTGMRSLIFTDEILGWFKIVLQNEKLTEADLRNIGLGNVKNDPKMFSKWKKTEDNKIDFTVEVKGDNEANEAKSIFENKLYYQELEELENYRSHNMVHHKHHKKYPKHNRAHHNKHGSHPRLIYN